ncbi:MAG: hypothetical protein QM564_13880 [Bergeyella sp.]
MKIDLTSSANQKQIASARSQIKESADLRKFDSFLAKYDVIDFNDSEQLSAAKGCCGGENCCQNITITPTFG